MTTFRVPWHHDTDLATDGEVLVYDADSGRWTPAPVSGGGGGSTPGSGIEYVSGVVTPDPAVAVHEYFTVGAATIDGVEYAAEQAVVLFRVQGSWVHRVVDLPQPPPEPTVTLLKTYVADDIPEAGTKSEFTFSAEGATVPADGVLVVAASTWSRSFSAITVGGVALDYAATTTGAGNLTPHIYCAPVTAGESLDVDITTNSGTSCLGISVILVTNVAPVPYAVKNGVNATPGTVPESPAGSVIITQRTNRSVGGNTIQGWEPEFTEVDNTTFPTNGPSSPSDGWTTWHRNAWAFSTGETTQADYEGGGDHAMIVLSRSAP